MRVWEITVEPNEGASAFSFDESSGESYVYIAAGGVGKKSAGYSFTASGDSISLGKAHVGVGAGLMFAEGTVKHKSYILQW